jgi:RNA polymerase sigma-70 factor (ECF subfamily)
MNTVKEIKLKKMGTEKPKESLINRASGTPEREAPAPVTDEELIERFQRGEVMAYEVLVKRHKERLLNFVYRFIGNLQDSEDIVQETFVRLYIHKNSYQPSAKFITWLFTIAGNLAKSELRKRKIRNVFSIHRYFSGSSGAESKDVDLPDIEITADQRADGKIKEEAIQKAILSLPAQFREAVVLRDVQDFSYEEISAMLKVPIGTVKSRVNRGRFRLQEILKTIND